MNNGIEPLNIKLQNRVIEFRTRLNLYKHTFQPVMDRRTKRLKGVDVLSEEQKRNRPYVVDHTTSFTVESGTTLDLSNYIDAVTWEWLKHCPEIAHSKMEALRGKAYFYIYDEAAEIEAAARLADLTRKALNYVHDTSDVKLQEKARLLEKGLEHLSPYQLRKYLNDLAMSDKYDDVMKIINIYEDPEAKERLFLLKLLDAQIVRNINEVMKFGDVDLGVGETQAIAFLRNPENANLVKMLRKRLYPEVYEDDFLQISSSKKAFNDLTLDDIAPKKDEEESSKKKK